MPVAGKNKIELNPQSVLVFFSSLFSIGGRKILGRTGSLFVRSLVSDLFPFVPVMVLVGMVAALLDMERTRKSTV